MDYRKNNERDRKLVIIMRNDFIKYCKNECEEKEYCHKGRNACFIKHLEDLINNRRWQDDM